MNFKMQHIRPEKTVIYVDPNKATDLTQKNRLIKNKKLVETKRSEVFSH